MNLYVCMFQVEALFAHRELRVDVRATERLERLLAAGAQELRKAKAKAGREAGGL
jgi:hypothetical protein